MKNRLSVFLLAAAAAAAGGAPARADFTFAEPPDLSGDRFAPSGPFVAGPGVGVNTLTGTVTGVSGTATDRDYFTVVIPAGFQFDALILSNYVSTPGNVAFLGLQAGPVVTVDPDNANPAPLLGYLLFGDTQVGENLLPEIGQGFGAIGFTGSLPAGTYSFWIQETSGSDTYTFDFRISPTGGPGPGPVVPEPASLSLVGLGAVLGLGYARRRRGPAAGTV